MIDDEDDVLAQEIEASEQDESQGKGGAPDSDQDIENQFANQPFRVVYQTNNFLLPQIKDLIADGNDFNIRPEYQRRLRWSNIQKSLLIESLLLNVPVPPVFFYENDLARYEVMDGQQRLNAISEFLQNNFSLRGLQILSSLNGRRYNGLPPRVKRSLDRASISAIVLLQESQGKIKKGNSGGYYELRRFVFERLNTGGKRLTAQEIRNAIYGGEFNDLIVSISREKIFTDIWGIPPYKNKDPNEYYEEEARQKNALYKTMGDCQIVLRFFALKDDKNIQGSMKSMLDKCMERNMDCSAEQAKKLKDKYLSRLTFAHQLFEGKPFGLEPVGSKTHRPVAGVYDGVMIALNEYWSNRSEILRNKGELHKAYNELIKKESPTGRLTGAANTSSDIKDRIRIFKELFSKFA